MQVFCSLTLQGRGENFVMIRLYFADSSSGLSGLQKKEQIYDQNLDSTESAEIQRFETFLIPSCPERRGSFSRWTVSPFLSTEE